VPGILATRTPSAPIVAFMAASPLTSPEELVLSGGLFGWPLDLIFFTGTITLGLAAGRGDRPAPAHRLARRQVRMRPAERPHNACPTPAHAADPDQPAENGSAPVTIPRTWAQRANISVEGMSSHPPFTLDQARAAGERIGIDWDASPFSPEQFRMGMDVELEHGTRDPQTNVTSDDVIMTAKIARAHLNEFPDYYTRLAKMEAQAEADRTTPGQ
jgi:hypothetical protein